MRGVEGRVGALWVGSPRVQRPKSQRGRSRAPGHPARQHGARRGGLCLTDSSVGGSAGYVGAGAAAPLLDNEAEVNATIDAILEGIKGTDSGASVSADKRKVIDGNIEKLIELSARQSSPLDNPGIFANYTVAYTSPGPTQNGAPAGGRFRGKLGRLLFRTEGLYQAILKPNLAKNLVTFWLFGLIPGSIGLTGTFVKLDKSTVKVVFERPRLTILGQTFGFGPKSSVELETPAFYANKIRIGRGSRGSLFVFTVDEKSKRPKILKQMDREPTKSAFVFIGLFLAALCAFLYTLQRQFGPKPLLLAVGLILAAASVLKKGGIVDDSQSEIKEG